VRGTLARHPQPLGLELAVPPAFARNVVVPLNSRAGGRPKPSKTSPEPSDSAFVRYVEARLKQMGAVFAEPEAVEETLSMNRDVWLRLYQIDREFDPAASDYG
jgi:hypothetical protein